MDEYFTLVVDPNTTYVDNEPLIVITCGGGPFTRVHEYLTELETNGVIYSWDERTFKPLDQDEVLAQLKQLFDDRLSDEKEEE